MPLSRPFFLLAWWHGSSTFTSLNEFFAPYAVRLRLTYVFPSAPLIGLSRRVLQLFVLQEIWVSELLQFGLTEILLGVKVSGAYCCSGSFRNLRVGLSVHITRELLGLHSLPVFKSLDLSFMSLEIPWTPCGKGLLVLVEFGVEVCKWGQQQIAFSHRWSVFTFSQLIL